MTTSDYLTISDSDDLDGLPKATWEIWLKPSDGTYNYHTLFHKGDTYKIYVGDNAYTNKILVELYQGGRSSIYSTNALITLGQWNYIAITFDGTLGSNNLKYYVNGEFKQQFTKTGSLLATSNDLLIGAGQGYYTKGIIDEARISNIARSAEEIAEAYRAGKDHRLKRTLSSTDLSSKNKLPFYIASDRTGTYLETYVGENSHSVYETDANTVGLWHLDEKSGSGAYLKDSSASAYNGTPSGATFTQGKIGGTRRFNGSSDYLSFGSVLQLDSSYTIEAWIKPRTFGNDEAILFNGDGSYFRYNFAVYASQKIGFSGNSTGAWAGRWTYYSNDTLTADQWAHVVVTRNGGSGSTAYFYINGVESGSFTDNHYATSAGPLYIGRAYISSNYYFDGLIDEVRVSNTSRSATEINQIYQYGLRTHQITIDYSTTAGSDGPTSTSDYEFTPDSVSGLYTDDTVIIRENVDGTTYIAQGEVTSISSGTVTVSSWAGTTPSGGYTTNANVFKWQREYWDITDISSVDRDTITKLGIRVLNGSEGFDMYLDDFKSNSTYMTDYSGSSISSTPQRYFQYRAILTTTDTTTSPSISSVTLNYTLNQTPTAPTSLLTEGQTNPSQISDTEPEFSAIYNDPDSGDIANKYRIQVDDDPAFGSPLWDSGESGTAMSNCNQGERCSDISYGGNILSGVITYYWRIKFWDDTPAEGDWSTEEAYFSLNSTPSAPTSLQTESQTNPSGVNDTTPEFSAVYNDLDSGDIANKYRIQVDDDPAFGSPLWDSGSSGTTMTNCTEGNRCSDISYGGNSTDLQFNTTYYWRIKFWDDDGAEGDWSTESAYFTMEILYPPTSCVIDDSSHSEQTIVKWADNTNLETGYEVQRSVDSGEFSTLTTEDVNSTSSTDSTTSADHTYKYRVRAISNNGNSVWCEAKQVNYGKGAIFFK